ncbi:alpha/beta hydrolase [Candidatus Saccharibacteria bacterium]|nr:alpha/beta hydrolase [Candidatus Saccharibacteria bacterium]
MKKNLIFIHGFRGDHLGLKEMAENYFDKKKFNIYLPDIPPAGEHSMESYTPLTYAKFIADYIKAHNIKKPILIGHSMGSIVAAATAERYPELLDKKIIFLSPISIKPSAFFAALTPFSILLPNRLVTYITTKYLFIPKDRPLFLETLAISRLCGADYVSRIEVFKSARFSSHYCISDFDFASKKACFISGEKDRLIPRKKTEYVARNMESPTFYIKNTGHLLNYENPKETAFVIKNFIRRKK